MFTGIIEDLARVGAVRTSPGRRRFLIEADCVRQVAAGDSLALNGVCLTAEAGDRRERGVWVSAVEETLRRTTAGSWRRGRRLHLERALAADGRFGGHIVQGHVDGLGRVMRIGREGREFILSVLVPPDLRRYVVSKGSLAVDGISLTVGRLQGGLARLYIIPETLERSLVSEYRTGDRVNLEVDLVAKYVESMQQARSRATDRGRMNP